MSTQSNFGTKREEEEEYVTPNTYELEKLFTHGSVAYTHFNEVWPNVYIGNEEIARDRHRLKAMGITHVLNAAEGERNSVNTGEQFYSHCQIHYYGITAEDIPSFDLSQHFYSSADEIEKVLREPENKLLIHCVMGRSRSVTLFLAFLMIHKNMTLVHAVTHLKQRRRICPNWGFLKQLRQLDTLLLEQRRASQT